MLAHRRQVPRSMGLVSPFHLPSSPSGWTLDRNRSLFVLMQNLRENGMYLVFVEQLEGPEDPLHTARTLEQAFAQIACRCGYSYRFEPAQEQGWCLFLIDVERPERSPDPIHSTCIKPRDAHHDLMSQAVDGRLKAMWLCMWTPTSGLASCGMPRAHGSRLQQGANAVTVNS